MRVFVCVSLQGDPLPASLVDLVRNSPVSSVDDLKLLLQREADAIGNQGAKKQPKKTQQKKKHLALTNVEEASVKL